MESCRPAALDPQEFQESAPEVRSEDRIAIVDDVGRQAMGPDNMLYEQRRHVRGRHRFRSRDGDRHLRRTVHNDHDRIVVVSGRIKSVVHNSL